MTLAALSHIPAQHQSRGGSSRGWRKGLALFSRSRHQHQSSSSRMALAAATEKFVRHSPPEVIKCEDLTAKEFAQLTGINLDANSSIQSHQITTRSAMSERPHPRIWDSDFWHHPSSPSSSSSCSSSTSTSNLPSLFSCMRTDSNSSSASRGPSIIRKGRFKIVVGQETEPVSPTTTKEEFVLEWKRKRADSCATWACLRSFLLHLNAGFPSSSSHFPMRPICPRPSSMSLWKPLSRITKTSSSSA